MSKFLGNTYTNNDGDKFVVKSQHEKGYFTIEFEDGTQTLSYYSNFIKGKTANLNKPRVCGVGCIGYGEFSYATDRQAHARWIHVLERCYSQRKQNECPSYVGCFVAEQWLNFQGFARDFYLLLEEGGDITWQIDKDILARGNKEYSYQNCVLLPEEINKCFVKRAACRGDTPIGVSMSKGKYKAQFDGHLGVYDNPYEAFEAYKQAKEKYIKLLAEKWKNKLSQRAYNGLMNYKVLITD